jgi:hypothetical protein
MRLAILASLILAACGGATTAATTPSPAVPSSHGTLAQVYYWKAKPGKIDEYSRYITDQAEAIDYDAQRHGAFLSVTTYVSRDTTSPWTHMRVFILRDSAQLRALSAQLDTAGMRVEPDTAKRRARGAYSATLRDRAGAAVLEVLR